MSRISTFPLAVILTAISICANADTRTAPQSSAKTLQKAGVASGSQESSFAVDIPRLIEVSVAKVLEDHEDVQLDDLIIEQDGIYFHCNPAVYWRFVNTVTLELPDQSGPASLCEARLVFILKDTLKKNSQVADSASGYCFNTIDFESVRAIVYGSGAIETGRGKGHDGGTVLCDEHRVFLPVDEAIAQYTNQEKPTEDSSSP